MVQYDVALVENRHKKKFFLQTLNCVRSFENRNLVTNYKEVSNIAHTISKLVCCNIHYIFQNKLV